MEQLKDGELDQDKAQLFNNLLSEAFDDDSNVTCITETVKWTTGGTITEQVKVVSTRNAKFSVRLANDYKSEIPYRFNGEAFEIDGVTVYPVENSILTKDEGFYYGQEFLLLTGEDQDLCAQIARFKRSLQATVPGMLRVDASKNFL